MHETFPLLEKIPFPAIRRGRLDTLQINVGYRCNQSCVHCHVGASPHRTEEMSGDIADIVLRFLERRRVTTLDITGGAPELNPHFRRMVTAAREMGVLVMDRCNLTIFEVEGQQRLPEFSNRLLSDRREKHAPALIGIWIRGLELARDPFQIRGWLLDRSVRLQASDGYKG